MKSSAYNRAYHATRAVFRAFDFVADHVVDAADHVLHGAKATGRAVVDAAQGVRDAASNSVFDIPQPRGPIIIDGHVIRRG